MTIHKSHVLISMGFALDVDFVFVQQGPVAELIWLSAVPQPTAEQIAAAEPAAQAALDAAEAARTAVTADKDDMKAQFAVDLDKLSAIVTAPSFTNAQRDAALQDLARVGRRMLKAIKATVL